MTAPFELAVYSCLEDVMLFVPVACLPSREAEATFGPLVREGVVRVCAEDRGWQPILSQVERHLFATVPRREGALLVGGALEPASCPAPLSPTPP